MEGYAATQTSTPEADRAEGPPAPVVELDQVRDAARAAEFATQIGPVMTTREAKLRAAEYKVGYKQDQERYEEMDWAPTA